MTMRYYYNLGFLMGIISITTISLDSLYHGLSATLVSGIMATRLDYNLGTFY